MVLTGPVIRRRLAVCMAAFFMLFTALGARLFHLQVIQSEALQRRAQSQWTSESIIAPVRGMILDRNGRVLAQSATAYTASVSPRQVTDAVRFAALLSPVLDVEEATILRRASDTSRGGVTLKRQLSRDRAQQLKAMKAEHARAGSDALNGLYLEEESKRYYPMGQFAAQLIGLTTIDGVGQSGLEQSLDRFLSGREGRILEEIDGKGRALGNASGEYVPAVNGGSVTLTLDASIQAFAEQAAREALSVNNAKAVRVLAMDPNTGAILAMVSKPDFDLNDPPRNDVAALTERMRNRVVADAYEPGSTFKILTAASALEAGVVTPMEGFYCSGSVTVDGGRIKCWGRPHGAETFAQALQNSCNPVFVEMGLRLGTDRFYDYLRAFGIGSKTGVDIPGEVEGIVIRQSAVKRVDLARIGFGQSVAVTPLQLLTAVCAVINGGNLMKPYIVQSIADVDGRVIEAGGPEVVGHPISKATSDTMRVLLEDVVALGGGKNAYLPGWHVGGKTGTAQVYVDGVVSSSTHIGSFIGFAPANAPKIALILIVDEADVAVDYGSVTAAPFAKQILERSLNYLGVAPDLDEPPAASVEVPDVSGMDVARAVEALDAAGLGHTLNGVGARVKAQLPAAGAEMSEGSLVMLYVEGAQTADDGGVARVPDVRGMSVLEANKLIRSFGLQMRIEGSGLAVSQSPAADEEVHPSTVVTVRFAAP
ncbi:MAG: PASTA domain-containing protein [Clostridia bacterium]|nr:PASTA domain-containing protein [Clostridia bacterium]